MSEGHFSLQFSGLESDSPEKLQRFKSICIADLDLSVEDTQGLLSTTETRILRTSSSLPELQAFLGLLSSAGARVAILSPDGSTAPIDNGSEGVPFDLEEILDLDIPLRTVPPKHATPRAPKEYHLDLDADLGDSLLTDSSLLFSEPLSSGRQAPGTQAQPHPLDDTVPTQSVAAHSVLEMSFVDDDKTTIAAKPSSKEDTIASLITSVKEEQDLHDFEPLDLVLGPTPEELSPRENNFDFDDSLSLDLPIMGTKPTQLVPPGSAPEAPSALTFSTSETTPTPVQTSPSVASRTVQPPSAPLQFAGLAFEEPTPQLIVQPEQPRAIPTVAPPQLEIPPVPLPVAPARAVVSEALPEVAASAPIAAVLAPPTTTLAPPTLEPPKVAPPPSSAPVPQENQPSSPPPPITQQDTSGSATAAPSKSGAPVNSIEAHVDMPATEDEEETSASFAVPAEAAPLSRLQLIGIFIGGLTLLLAGNWLLAPAPEETPVPEIGALSASEVVVNSSARIPKVSPASSMAVRPELKGEFKSDQFSLSVTVLRDTENKNAPTVTTRFVLTTPKPPDLTIEEIGQGTLPRIWLKRVESDAASLKASGSNEWSGSVPTYVFVERGAERRRLPALTLVSLTVNSDGSAGEAKIDISYAPPGDTTLPAQGLLIEATDKDGYRVAASATVPLKVPAK